LPSPGYQPKTYGSTSYKSRPGREELLQLTPSLVLNVPKELDIENIHDCREREKLQRYHAKNKEELLRPLPLLPLLLSLALASYSKPPIGVEINMIEDSSPSFLGLLGCV
jgi:hypothetical protein